MKVCDMIAILKEMSPEADVVAINDDKSITHITEINNVVYVSNHKPEYDWERWKTNNDLIN